MDTLILVLAMELCMVIETKLNIHIQEINLYAKCKEEKIEYKMEECPKNQQLQIYNIKFNQFQ